MTSQENGDCDAIITIIISSSSNGDDARDHI
jgi:hypothetical protein